MGIKSPEQKKQVGNTSSAAGSSKSSSKESSHSHTETKQIDPQRAVNLGQQRHTEGRGKIRIPDFNYNGDNSPAVNILGFMRHWSDNS